MALRFKYMKLAGFKSFVDPTKVVFPSDLVGIIGPNGCGKSNTIDAVRWVMGESSAKQLRGESITDVIFNGSSRRKPVGQASIELVFDNSDASLGGPYAKYAEISIRREVNRDGVSNYYLNGGRCRRKDITDVFKGTGLGPRSYAIIEQGTISRLIEAKPDEMRVHFEEVAQISKYKERRRETELRIKHARENLERLEDVREELQKQLNHLNRQAAAAKRYKELKEQERSTRANFTALQWKEIQYAVEATKAKIMEQETALEAQNSELSTVETTHEKQRLVQEELTDQFNEVQQRYYSAGNDISRVEQDIAHRNQRGEQLQQDITQAKAEMEESQQSLVDDEALIAELTTEIETLTPEFETVKEEAEASKQALEQAEQAMQSWQQEWEAFNKESAQATQDAEVEQTRIQHLEQKISAVTQRLDKLDIAKRELRPTEELEQELQSLNEQVTTAESDYETAAKALTDVLDSINSQRETNQQLTTKLDDARNAYQRLQGKLASIEALQQAALGKKDSDVSQWLNQHQLGSSSRLAEKMNVEPKWQVAVETVLGANLQAVCAANTTTIAEAINQLKHGSITLIDTDGVGEQPSSGKFETLLSKVTSSINITGLLGNIYVADSVQSALAKRAELSVHESIVTTEGVWLGRNWVRVVKSQDAESGVLQREQELKQLKQESDTTKSNIDNMQSQLEKGRQDLHNFESQQEQAQTVATEKQTIMIDLRAQVKVKQSDLEQIIARSQQIEKELVEFNEALTTTRDELAESRSVWQKAIELMDNHTATREQKMDAREVVSVELQQAREKANADKERRHECEVRLSTATSQCDATKQAFERLQKALVQLQERCQQLDKQLEENTAPITELKAKLEEQLQHRLGVEKSMNEVKQRLNVVAHDIRELEDRRSAIEESRQAIRETLEQIRLDSQEGKVRSQTLQEQMSESGFDLEQVLADIDPQLTADSAAEELEGLERKISRLGAINLAAIEELEELGKRKEFLDEQNKDLVEALETLEDAIDKIDKETKERFRETFETVNETFKELFPKVFGGGQATLELTGDDWLTAGITVMAQPPGKRNGTIHLLSGGEKALTAIALVFSIFKLSPSPFCMLDEVDAPLDDANVSRFCNLVKEMSKSVQFIVITHNKVTMEMVDHLVGVTMSEPGCSRLVAVDIDEAVELAVA